MTRVQRKNLSAKTVEELAIDVQLFFEEFARVVNGKISLGDGTDKDNLDGQFLTITTHASAGTESSETHNLGRVPTGYLILSKDAAGILYDGSTAWTTSTITFRASTNSLGALVFVI